MNNIEHQKTTRLNQGFATPVAIVIVALIAIIGGVSYFATKEASPTKEESAVKPEGDVVEKETNVIEKKPSTNTKQGTYGVYSPEKIALASEDSVLLFFHAPWCPTCRALESEINSNPSAIPNGVHILKVDYDTAIALRQKYGVTVQHTFVQVNTKGDSLQKWSDTYKLAQVLGRIK